MRRFWEYGLLVAIALAIGVVVASVVALAMTGSGADVPTYDGDLAALVVSAAAGLVSIVLTLDAGLRRLNRPRAKIGW